MPRQKKQKAIVKQDGVENVLTGLGQAGRDASVYSRFGRIGFLPKDQLENAYLDAGIARRIVDLLPDDAMKKGLECDTELYNELDRLNAFSVVATAAKDARLFGGALILVLAKDGAASLALPLNEGSLKRVEKLAVYDRHQCSLTAMSYDNDPFSPTFGEVKTYQLNSRQGQILNVHASRIIRLDGERLPASLLQNNGGWHASALQGCYQALLSYASAQGFADTIIKEWSLSIIKIQGLFDSYGNGGEKQIAARINDANVSKSMMNAIFLDAENEDFSRDFSNVTGYSELVVRGMEVVASSCGIPMTKLFGRSPEGMSATGEGDARNWASMVEAFQIATLQPVFNRLIALLGLQQEWKDKPDSLEWEFPPVLPLSEQERADVRLKHAQADAIYIREGGVDAAYLFNARHEGGFSANPQCSLEGEAEFGRQMDATAASLGTGSEDAEED
ncbi:phge_rel_HI1409, phage-associated protein, HI1409 family [uncultured Caudovirales phage]|uniref:Phge_rel_HI1409, phage-associated protein, HI1409 family n=1 Tax=uncultured Caudovirales phage TaxID=2100421 RepID=A0A6J7WZ86_9CAUD|nr:phge_rel_HI1409, phage-associated protein, HI1409 family [uncultured Caudovirales phage]